MVKKISAPRAPEELKNVGFDSSYREQGIKKHKFLSFKIFGLIPQQATILKQAAISVGTDCGVHRHIIDFKVDKTDCVLSGSIKEFEYLCEKLEKQPFSLKKLAEDIREQLKIYSASKKPVIMGILNLTHNSFSDGGEFLDEAAALEHVDLMINEGAGIIDIGAESTAPGAKEVAAEAQNKLLVPMIKKIRAKYSKILISVDTRSAKVAREAILAGADIINDVSGFSFEPEILDVAIESGKKLVIAHSRGIPENMNDLTDYNNVVDEVYLGLKQKCDFAISKGLKPENIIIDPGFGFAKNGAQNLELFSRVGEFKSLGFEVLVGVSRKRFLEAYSDTDPKNRDGISATASFYLAQQGVDIIRVHDVKSSLQATEFALALT